MKAAKEWGKAPSFLLGGSGEWSERDRVMAMGYELYASLLCPECGRPLSVCRDPRNDGWFEVQAETCFAKRAVEEKTGAKDYKHEPGEVIYPVLGERTESAPAFGARPW